MTTNKLRNLVTEAVSLDRQQSEIEARLAEIKEQLIAEADTRPDEHTATDGGGWSWTAEGTDGCIARITQAGPTLKSSISTDKDIERAKTICGPLFLSIFTVKISYKLGRDFREVATRLLGPINAARLVKAFSARGKTTINYETKEAA